MPRRFQMHAISILVVLAITSAIATNGDSNPNRKTSASNAGEDADKVAIKELERRDIIASKKNDVDTLISVWTDDGVLLAPYSAPVMGKQSIRELLEQQKRQSKNLETTAYDEDWKEPRIVDNYAFEWGQIAATVRLATGKEVNERVNAMRVLERQTDRSWKVARVIVSPAGKKD